MAQSDLLNARDAHNAAQAKTMKTRKAAAKAALAFENAQRAEAIALTVLKAALKLESPAAVTLTLTMAQASALADYAAGGAESDGNDDEGESARAALNNAIREAQNK